jgi:hypothetical protein
MPCEQVRFENGVSAIICTKRKRKKCAFCERWATRLCAFPHSLRKSGTCDKPLCDRHARSILDADYCHDHPKLPVHQLALAL